MYLCRPRNITEIPLFLVNNLKLISRQYAGTERLFGKDGHVGKAFIRT